MINFSEMAKYLRARKNREYFIPRNCILDSSDLENLSIIFAEFSSFEIEKCFEPNDGIACYCCEVPCNGCKEIFYINLSKTSLVSFMKKRRLYSCEKCNKIYKERKKIQAEIDKSQSIASQKEKTLKYIEVYLNPTNKWENGVKNWDKWNSINQYGIDYEQVADFIKSLNYQDFLRTPYWKAISEKKKKQAEFKCNLCNGSEKLACHHRTYETHGYEHDNLQDLIILCDECHKKFHDIETSRTIYHAKDGTVNLFL